MQDILVEPRPQVSADGRWWWNGHEWRPIAELPAPAAQSKSPTSRWLPTDRTDRRLVVVGYVLPFCRLTDGT